MEIKKSFGKFEKATKIASSVAVLSLLNSGITQAEELDPPTPTAIINQNKISTKSGELQWRNTTDLTFNEQSAVEIFNQLEDLPNFQSYLSLPEGFRSICIKTLDHLNDPITEGCLAGRFSVRPMRRSMMQIQNSETKVASAKTLIINGLQGDYNYTFTQLNLISGSDTNFFFGTEACQATLVAEPLDINPNQNDLQHLLQEGLCNSWGVALSAKASGIDYQGYLELINDSFFPIPVRGKYLGVIPIPEEEYLKLSTKPILS